MHNAAIIFSLTTLFLELAIALGNVGPVSAREHRSREVTRVFQRGHTCSSTGQRSGTLDFEGCSAIQLTIAYKIVCNRSIVPLCCNLPLISLLIYITTFPRKTAMTNIIPPWPLLPGDIPKKPPRPQQKPKPSPGPPRLL
jgi:hypothetical protein